ncbi:hypothetical protein H0266_09940 [Halobacillus locisalis]|uniref:Uncharacterized protein n=1 Tax=Halobacillus locisalis TaxID=220753 RepID=A0A838CTE5_9BACI|nr:hypothetical protein [Halobacillus locisalis]MBA2175214.1 hypothetical protein [Halobacillus locisalis]
MKKRRREKKGSGISDGIFEVLFWVPELILLPLRAALWLLRGVGRVISHMWDGI